MVLVNSVNQGDCLQILDQIPDKCIQLIYTDPPFGTGNVQQLNRMKNGLFVDNLSYDDGLSGEIYLNWLSVRLKEMHRVLRDNGSIYLHLDYRNVHYVKIIMDEIFGQERFLNEIIWAYDYGGRPKDRWPKKHDTILWYSKSDKWIFNYNDIDRIPYMAPGLVGPTKAERGKLPTDTWWMTIVPTQGTERTGYPNQKPIKLAERIICASSNPGGVVADFFCGSGTVGEAAKKLGRDFVLVDKNPEAVEIAKMRIFGKI